MFNIQIMARNVRTNVKKMVNHTIGVGKSLNPGIIVHLMVRNKTFFKYNYFCTKLKQSGYFKQINLNKIEPMIFDIYHFSIF